MPVSARKTATFPTHEYADEHKVMRAQRELGGKRRLRDAATLRPSGEVACARIREFGWDVGAELRNAGVGWMAWVSRHLGLNESTGWYILSGNATRVSTQTVDTVAQAVQVPIRVFYDPEL